MGLKIYALLCSKISNPYCFEISPSRGKQYVHFYINMSNVYYFAYIPVSEYINNMCTFTAIFHTCPLVKVNNVSLLYENIVNIYCLEYIWPCRGR